MSKHHQKLYGGIEAGGTKFVCAFGYGPGAGLLARQEFPTGKDPIRRMGEICAWFSTQQSKLGRLSGIGVASFGPVDLHPASPSYGCITTTPKIGWQYAEILGPIRQAFPGIPLGFDTDVNGAALGEHRWGAAQGLQDFVYITIGTGIGGGGMARGQLLHGMLHPEMGHMGLPEWPGDTFAGACLFHRRCWEGLCSGPALEKRTGKRPELIPPADPAWQIMVHYLAHALKNLTCVLSPQKIILGGSVAKGGLLGAENFLAQVRSALRSALGGYLSAASFQDAGLVDYLVSPALGDDAGVCGALALAQDADQRIL